MMISVVIPAHNAAETIAGCVDALQRQTLPREDYEIIVVDDGSTDETSRLAEEGGAMVIFQEPSGAAAARNAGVRQAKGEIICFTDADCQPTADWLAQICLPFEDPDIIGCKGIYATSQRELTARFVQIEYEDKYDLLRGQERIDFIDTYSAAYRRSVLLANDGFDEGIRYVEDQEFSFRLSARGYQMVFQPTAVVYHLHSSTVTDYLVKKFNIGYWKAQIIRRFPGQGVRDSHTPQVMKVQMALMAAVYGTAAAALFTRWAALLCLFFLALFLLTTASFIRKAWSKDRSVALSSPFFLAIRATGLGFGYGWGVLRPKPGLTSTESTIGGLNYIGKRAIDILGSLIGLSLALVLGPFISVAIKLTSPGPVLFRQERVGQGGQPFTIYKFRSMCADAEDQLDSLINLDRLNEPVFKLADDPRITPLGRFLRRWSLDELPQFWNVFKGDMSLIGPRPEEARIVALYTDWHRRRLAIKPGMTGPMQVNGRGDLPLDTRVRLELEYIDHYTLWQDIVILARTIPAVVKGDGAR